MMRFYHVQRWAKAFLDASGGNAQQALLWLKEFFKPVKLKQGAFFGYGASAKLEKILREFADSDDAASEIAIRFICLLTEKKCLRYIEPIMEKIEQMLNEKNGIISVTVESAFPVDEDFKKELEKNIIKMKNMNGVKMKTRINPRLLGGYMIRIKSFYIDASLKGQLEKMKAELSDCPLAGGVNV